MAANTHTSQLLADCLSDAGAMSADEALPLLQSVVAHMAAMHQAGRLHGAIFSTAITIDDQRHPTLLAAGAATSDDISNDGAGHWPPELDAVSWETLPADVTRARSELQTLGVRIDPRRIDVHQLGRLACELVSGHSADSYLLSPRGKAMVPAPWRQFIDGLLGYDPATRLSTCEQVQGALTALAEVIDASSSDASRPNLETPPRGTGIDVTQNTPVEPHKAAPQEDEAHDPSLPFATLGHYRIVARLGSGGMGDVYRGYEPALDRTVAIKVLPMALSRQADFVRRFTDEARAAARLVHPNIVQIYFIGEDAGHHFFAMQHVEGESLAGRLSREKKLSLEGSLEIVEQIVAGLAVAHRQGMIHRDIKPANILLDAKHDRALLADFGLVKSLDNSAAMTATGMVMGTVDYIAPEQGRGHAVDGRSDLYSIGVLLYQMLSGRLPFEADSATAMIFQHAYERPRPLEDVAPHLPRGARAIVYRLMAKDPGHRYQTAEELLADLRSLRASHDFQPAALAHDSEWRETSVIIAAPRFDAADDERRLSSALAPLSRLRWQDRLRATFERHAPEALKNLQNTQQQIDGALAVYQSRREQLVELAREARVVEKELAAQVKAHEQAASHAPDTSQRRQQEQTAASLAAHLAEQREQRDAIDLRLFKVNATLQKLRSQHGLLNARLHMAAAGQLTAEGGMPRRRRTRLALVACYSAAILAGLIMIRYLRDGAPSPMTYLVEQEATTPLPGDSGEPARGKDLLKRIDVRRDAITGKWSLTPAGLQLENPTGVSKYLQVPYEINGSYELRMRLSHTDRNVGSRDRAIVIRFPVGSRRAALMAYTDGRGLGINSIFGRDSLDPGNPTARPDLILTPGTERELILRVSVPSREASDDPTTNSEPPVGISLRVNGEEIINWWGDQAKVGLRDSEAGKRLPAGPLVFISGFGSNLTFQQLDLRMLDGTVRFKPRLPPPTGARESAPQAGVWQINYPAGAQRGVTITEAAGGKFRLQPGGSISGLYGWDGRRLVMEQPEDVRYQHMIWQWNNGRLVLVEEPPDHPSGATYAGATLKFISDDISAAARDAVPKLPSRIKPRE